MEIVVIVLISCLSIIYAGYLFGSWIRNLLNETE